MHRPQYRFEQFIDPDFPLYISNPSNKGLLTQSHYHKAAELILVTQGTVQVMIGINTFICAQGEILFVPPLTMHEVIALTDNARIRGVIYETSLLETPHIRIDFQQFLRGRPKQQLVFSPEHADYETLRTHYDKLLAVYDSLPDKALTIELQLQLLSYLLLIHATLFNAFPPEDQAIFPDRARLRPVLAYIDAHFSEKIHISDLSSLLYTCDDQLIRLFKSVTGETPMEYIINMRLEAAMKLLTSTKLSIADIAEQTGFNSGNYMTRIFRQKLNRSPRSYR